jgi:hypothetical protein
VETAIKLVLPLLGETAGANDQARWRSPRAISSFISRPAMIVLPAPGSSARRKRSGWRGSMASYTAVIWCGRGACRYAFHPDEVAEAEAQGFAMCSCPGS